MLKIKCFASSSKGNMYLVQNEETKILLECGMNKDYIMRMLNANGMMITNLNACIISHWHT